MAIKVFIDTNIYEITNFSFYNKQLSRLRELTEEGTVELLYNEIVYKEVYQHIGDNLSEAISKYNQVIEENRAFAPFRADDKWGPKIEQIVIAEMVDALRKWWDEYLSSTDAIKIPISGVDIDDIVNKYFNRQYPFEAKKPTEFKDAICVDSLLKYYENCGDEKICIVAADKGFRRSFRGREGFVLFSDMNSFLNYAILQTEHIDVQIEEAFTSDTFEENIKRKLDDLLDMSDVNIEDVYDDIDVTSIETQSVEYGYIHECDEDSAVVIANASININVEYSVRDEDNSYYDREDDRYYWENFIEYSNTFSIKLEIEVALSINKNEDDLSLVIDIDDVDADKNIYLREEDICESEIIHETINDEEEPYDPDAEYCPDCGCKMTYINNAGAFCVKCAPNH